MKHIGWWLVGAAVVAGFAYSLYKTATPAPNSSSTPDTASTSVMPPLYPAAVGVSGLVPFTFSGDISNTTAIAPTNPGGF